MTLSSPPNIGANRVLVVDDQEANLEVLRRRLERRGYEVLCRDNAIGIEDAIRANRIDCVLLDWMMPHRSGSEALAALRERFDKDHLPIIIVTAVDDSQTIADALAGGANDYVSKPIDMPVLLARMQAQLERRSATIELERIQRTLEDAVQARTRDLVDANASLSAEIAERKHAEARAHSLAREDALTGLANRRYFLEELERRTETSSPFALIFIDLDRFKPVNDVYGHHVGDELLIQIGRRLRALIRSDSIAARLGGDEFAVLVPGAVDEASVHALGRRLLAELSAPMMIENAHVQVGASMGAVRFPLDGHTSEALLRRADAAMLQAKTSRGSFMFFDLALEQQLTYKATLEAELGAAIAENQIVPFFQPIVALESGAPLGYEVLARWRHPYRGMISPKDFIPIAEESGLIAPMFWALLRRALTQVLEEPGDFFVAINLSPTQIRDQWFPQKILAAIRDCQFPAQRLVIEVTESSMIADRERAKSSLVSLRNQGIRIALDDFGTGFSSLSLLRELPFDKLKIDRSFVSGMLENTSDAMIVDVILGLGASMNFEVVAEGIESADVAEALLRRGCVIGQGFLYGAASPMPRLSVERQRLRA